jgi:hypothetical protein
VTFYQRVKKQLVAEGPITYPNLADFMGADEDAVRQALCELHRRGKATVMGDRIVHSKTCLWTATRP